METLKLYRQGEEIDAQLNQKGEMWFFTAESDNQKYPIPDFSSRSKEECLRAFFHWAGSNGFSPIRR